MAFDAGQLDREIVIEQPTFAQDSFGEPDTSWSTLDTVWAKFIPRSSGESFKANQRFAEADAIFRIRYRTDINRKMRISFDGQRYDIKDILPLGRQEKLEIYAKVQGAT